MKKLCLLLAFLIWGKSYSQKINNGADVINAMYKKYDGGKKWYKHFSFTQDAIFYRNDSAIKTEVWHEVGSFPGYLAIKFDKKDSKDGVIFAVNKVYSIKDGVAKEPKPFIHDLILVGFDVYFLKPERTIQLLDSLGYNLKSMHIDVFEGRHQGLILAEIEFENQSEVDKVVLPSFVLKDVTEDPFFTGGKLVTMTDEEFQQGLSQRLGDHEN